MQQISTEATLHILSQISDLSIEEQLQIFIELSTIFGSVPPSDLPRLHPDRVNSVIPVPYGTFRQEMVRCGKTGCTKCPHGPYWYLYFRVSGKLKSRYIGKVLPDTYRSP